MYPFTGNPLSYCVPIDIYIYSPVVDRRVYKRDEREREKEREKKIIKKTQTPKVQ